MHGVGPAAFGFEEHQFEVALVHDSLLGDFALGIIRVFVSV